MKINPTQLANHAKQIEQGLAVYERFSPQEQRGLSAGGRIHVEASLIAGRSVETGTSKEDRNESQEKDIEHYAKQRGIWFDNVNDSLTGLYDECVSSGMEALVWYDQKRGMAIKSVNTWQYRTLEEALDCITLHNTYFPETAIKVVGFGANPEGDFQIIKEQPYVWERAEKASMEQIEDYITRIGFEKHDDGLRHNFYNSQTLLRDLHPENVIFTPEENIIVIDGIMRLNTPDWRFGGKRKVLQKVVFMD